MNFEGLVGLWKDQEKPIGFLDPPDAGQIARWRRVVRRAAPDCTDYFAVGIGGSALPIRAMMKFFLPKGEGRVRAWVLDSIDSRTRALGPLIARCRHPLIHVISKSGTTMEIDLLRQWIMGLRRRPGPGRFPKNFLVTTSPAPRNPLEIWANKWHIPILPLPADIGGRYSTFSAVTYVLGSLLGLDLEKISEGARRARQNAGGAWRYAQWLAGLHERRKRTLGLFCYGDCLEGAADLLIQLFAESLGKQGKGFSPHRFMGTRDQHSLLQLYLGSPWDKCATFLTTPSTGGPWSEAFHSSYLGVARALTRQGVDNRTIRVSDLDEMSYGKLIGFFHIAVASLGHLLKVNPFDQPSVEIQKKITSRLLRIIEVHKSNRT